MLTGNNNTMSWGNALNLSKISALLTLSMFEKLSTLLNPMLNKGKNHKRSINRKNQYRCKNPVAPSRCK
jgi:hypothetical protein